MKKYTKTETFERFKIVAELQYDSTDTFKLRVFSPQMPSEFEIVLRGLDIGAVEEQFSTQIKIFKERLNNVEEYHKVALNAIGFREENDGSSKIQKLTKYETIEEQESKVLLSNFTSKHTFERTWLNARFPPIEGGRYWCIVEEHDELGLSTFQWNCSWNPNTKEWRDRDETMNVIYYTDLASMPN